MVIFIYINYIILYIYIYIYNINIYIYNIYIFLGIYIYIYVTEMKNLFLNQSNCFIGHDQTILLWGSGRYYVLKRAMGKGKRPS